MNSLITSLGNKERTGEILGNLATMALIEEAELTPKPGLVDMRNSGAHTDLNIDIMRRSAKALRQTFVQMSLASFNQLPSQVLREKLAEIGREGERVMLATTGGTNTHRGAIWALGLLIAGAAINKENDSPESIAYYAGEISRYPDRFVPMKESNGMKVKKRYGKSGAREEANRGFPHVIHTALPMLRSARSKGISEKYARLDTLLAIMSSLDDTCLLHRGGFEALQLAQEGARNILSVGGTSTIAGWNLLEQLDIDLISCNASPGGSADLLAATIFLDSLHSYKKLENDRDQEK